MYRQKISDILHRASYYLFFLSWIVLIASIFILFTNFELIQNHVNDWGKKAGNLAIILLWVVSLPGILKRFQAKGFLQSVQIVFMKSRRRLGILMFALAIIHAMWVRSFLYIHYTYVPKFEDIELFERFGLLAMALLIPLFVTSNDYSVRMLKKNWHRIHYLIYATMWLSALHVALQGNWTWAVPTFTIAILQLLSRMHEYRLKKKALIAVPATPVPPLTQQTPTMNIPSQSSGNPQ